MSKVGKLISLICIIKLILMINIISSQFSAKSQPNDIFWAPKFRHALLVAAAVGLWGKGRESDFELNIENLLNNFGIEL